MLGVLPAQPCRRCCCFAVAAVRVVVANRLLLTALAVGCCSSGCSSSEEANATPRFIVALPSVVPAVVAVLWVVL